MRHPSRTKRLVSALALVVTGALTLSACGQGSSAGELVDGSWDDVVAAAEEEGKVVFYIGASADQAKRVADAFNEKHPDIEVVIEAGGGDIIPRVEAQMKTKTEGADVFMHADPTWYRTHEDELLTLSGSNGEGLRDDAWIVPDKAVDVHGSPYSMFVWNTQMFPEGFSDWDDFLKPEVKGKLGFRADATKSAAGFLDFMESKVSEDYLKQMGAQKPKLYPSVVPITQAVAAGEVGATVAALPSVVKQLQASGAPLDFAYPDEGYGIEYVSAALENARHPNAAVVFMDFMLSVDGQESLNGDGYGVPARDGVEGALDPAGWTWQDSEKLTPDVLADWERKLDRALK